MKELNNDQLAILDAFCEKCIDYIKLNGSLYGCLDEIGWSLDVYVQYTGFTKYKVTKLRKELAKLGYLVFVKGLLSEDSGGYFGAAYFLTRLSLPYVTKKVYEKNNGG